MVDAWLVVDESPIISITAALPAAAHSAKDAPAAIESIYELLLGTTLPSPFPPIDVAIGIMLGIDVP
jgi:hypothetical protein